MKKLLIFLVASLFSYFSFAQNFDIEAKLDSIEKSFKYEYGAIPLKNGVAVINVPKGYKYLDAVQAEKILVEMWGNPKEDDMTLGLILPENQKILSDVGYVFNVQYDEIGYVKDNDADDINYSELLKEMQTETNEANKIRTEKGYEPISLVGWAATPFYDKGRKILHWAKEIKFGNEGVNTLNYNVRVLGRKGVLVLNAITTMPNLATVQQDIPQILDIVQFNDGYKYGDFNPSIDQVAAWTIGGLVAGKILAKAGLFAILLKFWKVAVVAIVAFFSTLWKKWKGNKEEEVAIEEESPSEEPQA